MSLGFRVLRFRGLGFKESPDAICLAIPQGIEMRYMCLPVQRHASKV